MIITQKQLFSYCHNCLSHHPPVFALFLFYEKKTCTKRKVGGGDEPALSARTCRSSASKTSSRAALASPLHPPSRGKSRENQALPSRASPAIINRSLAGYRSRVHSGKYSEQPLTLIKLNVINCSNTKSLVGWLSFASAWREVKGTTFDFDPT